MAPRMTVEISTSVSAEAAVTFAADCRGLPWMGGTREFTTDRTAVRAVDTTVAFAVEVP